MSTPGPSEPRPEHESPTLPPDSATADGAPAGAGIHQPASPLAPRAGNPAPRNIAASPQQPLFPELRESHLRSRPRRRVTLPIVLFIATCLSTFWVGAASWRPQAIDSTANIGKIIADHWPQGLTYMGAVLAILLTHEMGHFLQTVRYHIPASYPLCIPVPFSLIGTMGAVISMDGMRANRKQIFDIGIAGPLAGLVVAAPILLSRREATRSLGGGRAARYSTLQSR